MKNNKQRFEFNLLECELSSSKGELIVYAENAIKVEHITAQMSNFVDIFYKTILEFEKCGLPYLAESDLYALGDKINSLLTKINSEITSREEDEREENARNIEKDEAQMLQNQWVDIKW